MKVRLWLMSHPAMSAASSLVRKLPSLERAVRKRREPSLVLAYEDESLQFF